MTADIKIKPTRIWPIWVFYGIIFIVGMIDGGNPQAVANLLWVAIILSVIIHVKNRKNFGKKYLKNPKPTKEIIEKSKSIKFVPSKTHLIIIYTLTFISFAIGLFIGGILGGILLGFGVNLLTDSIIRLTKKVKDSKVIFSLIIGIILIIGGGWFSYNSLMSAIDTVTEDYMQDCDTFCANSEDVDYDLYTQYYVEFDQNTKSFICYCLTDSEETLAQKNLPLK
jgi:hypothetical protein